MADRYIRQYFSHSCLSAECGVLRQVGQQDKIRCKNEDIFSLHIKEGD